MEGRRGPGQGHRHLAFGIGVLAEMVIKLKSGVPPSSGLMLIFGGIALAANLTCLRLLWRFRRQDVNMSSTFECSRNHAISNVGVLLAAGGVALTGSPWPNLLAGTVVAAIFLRSAVQVIRDAVPVLRAA